MPSLRPDHLHLARTSNLNSQTVANQNFSDDHTFADYPPLYPDHEFPFCHNCGSEGHWDDTCAFQFGNGYDDYANYGDYADY